MPETSTRPIVKSLWLSIIIALVSFGAGTVSFAQEGAAQTELEMSLRLRLRGELRLNQTFQAPSEVLAYKRPDNGDLTVQQTHVGFKAKRGNMSAFVLLQQALSWGTTGGNALTDAPIGLHQAWFEVAPGEAVSVQVGRMELSYGDQKVLGAVGWDQIGRAWDGLKLKYTPAEALKLDVFAAQYNEGSAGTTLANAGTYSGGLFDDDAWLAGLYMTVGEAWLDPVLSTVDVYVLGETTLEAREPDADTSTDQRRRLTSGVRFHGDWGMWGGTAEAAYQTGSVCVPEDAVCTNNSVDLNAWFFDTQLSLQPMKSLTVLVGFGQASGDDPDSADTNEAYNHLYPTAHAFLGLTDIVGPRTNIRELRLGLRGKAGQFSFYLMGHDFTRLEPEERRTGTEIDTILTYKFSKQLNMQAGHGLFLPAQGATLDQTSPQGVAHWGFLQTQASF